MNKWKSNHLIFFLLLTTGIFSCKPNERGKNQKPLVITTTGMISDGLKNILGDVAEVKALMGPGVDPHLYKATQGDLALLESADYIFYNGIHLEGKMAEIFQKMARNKPVVAVGDGVSHSQLRQMQLQEDTYDPHIWFDVKLWQQAIDFAADTLEKLLPEQATGIAERKNIYHIMLDSLDVTVKTRMAEIPQKNRVLVTAHDAFGYFGRAYGVEVKALQGISTVSEFGLKDVTDLVDFISKNKIPSLFVETSVPEKYLRSVMEGCQKSGHEVKIGGSLFSDAMGANGTPEGTYRGMVMKNVNTIVEGLK